jgi:site-specific recombinase XerD
MASAVSHKLTKKDYVALREAAKKLPLDASSFQVWKHLRDEILIRLLYEITMNVGDLLDVRVEDVDLDMCSICLKDPEIIARIEDVFVHEGLGSVYFDESTRHLLIQYLTGRKRGPLIMNNREERMSVRTAERIVDECARLAGIQRIRGYTFDKDGRRRALKVVTCRTLSDVKKVGPGSPSAVSGSERSTVKRMVKVKRKLPKRAASEV